MIKRNHLLFSWPYNTWKSDLFSMVSLKNFSTSSTLLAISDQQGSPAFPSQETDRVVNILNYFAGMISFPEEKKYTMFLCEELPVVERRTY